MLRALVRFYQTGDLKDWHDFNFLWIQNNEAVDFASGFIEVYRDARGIKGSSQMVVAVVDQELAPLMHKLADNAVYFERKAPWEERFKKLDVKPPVGKAIETLIASGDFSVATTGDNLPNEQDIREKYGTKSIMLTSTTNAVNASRGAKAATEFSDYRTRETSSTATASWRTNSTRRCTRSSTTARARWWCPRTRRPTSASTPRRWRRRGPTWWPTGTSTIPSWPSSA